MPNMTFIFLPFKCFSLGFQISSFNAPTINLESLNSKRIYIWPETLLSTHFPIIIPHHRRHHHHYITMKPRRPPHMHRPPLHRPAPPPLHLRLHSQTQCDILHRPPTHRPLRNVLARVLPAGTVKCAVTHPSYHIIPTNSKMFINGGFFFFLSDSGSGFVSTASGGRGGMYPRGVGV